MNDPLFLTAPFFFLRSPRLPVEEGDRLIREKKWAEAVFHYYQTSPLLQEAIAIGSPSLAEALERREKKEDLAMSLLNYVMRMSSRATPFGLFSFVAMGAWEEREELFLKLEKVKKRTRPDMGWIFEYVKDLYQKGEAHLPVHLNPLVTVHGERCHLAYARFSQQEKPVSEEALSIRASPLVKAIFLAAEKPKAIENVRDDVLQVIPGLEGERVEVVIRELLARQFLLPSLLPSLLSFSPFDELVGSRPELQALKEKIEAYDAKELGAGRQTFKELCEYVQKTGSMSFQVDTVYPEKVHLPKEVGRECARAMELLWKLSLQHKESPMAAYHGKFLEKYGTDRTVPLLDLLSDEVGLGPWSESERSGGGSSPLSEKWGKWLFQAVQECLIEEREEVVLTESIISMLLQGEEIPFEEALNSADIFCKVEGKSLSEIGKGNYRLIFVQPSWEGGSSLGRFVDLLEKEAHQEIQAYVREQENEGELKLELSCWPRAARQGNVSAHPCFRNYRLDANRPKEKGVNLSLQDIYVGAYHDRLYLTLKEGGQEIVVSTGNMLNPLAYPLPFRFMQEVTLAKSKLLYPFNRTILGKNSCVFPRIVYQKTVLSSKMWNVDPTFLNAKELEKEFLAWGSKWALPEECFFIEGDRQLLVHPYNLPHLKEFVRRLKNKEKLLFGEVFESSWVRSEKGHHLSEVVIPLVKNPIYARKRTRKALAHVPVDSSMRWRWPGSEWLFAKLYLKEEGAAKFIIGPLREFLEDLKEKQWIESFFFIRYADPRFHLRVRLKVKHPTAVLTDLNRACAEWVERSQIREMVLSGYEREVERYGGVELISYAEEIFAVDSLVAIPLIAALEKEVVKRPVFHALSAICFLKGFGLDGQQMIGVLQGKKESLEGYREHKKELLLKLQSLEEGSLFSEPFMIRKEAQKTFSEKAALEKEKLYSIYSSMLHMHHNRMGCSLKEEAQARSYASQALSQVEKRLLQLDPIAGEIVL